MFIKLDTAHVPVCTEYVPVRRSGVLETSRGFRKSEGWPRDLCFATHTLSSPGTRELAVRALERNGTERRSRGGRRPSACVARGKQMLLLAVSDATATTLALLLFGLILAPLLFSVHRTTNRIEADDALDQAEEKATQRSVRIVSKATPELKSAVDLRCAIDSLKTLYDEYKYIELGELLDAIRADITSCKHGDQATVDAKEKLEALLLSDALPQIEARIRTCKDALAALSDTEGWELVNNKKEMRMFQRWREGNELQVKIEAVLGPDPPVRTADTIIVWREAQLYGRWFPMISSGFKIKEFSHCEVVIHLIAALNFMHCGECTTRIRSSTCGHAYHGCSLADGAFESRHPSWCFYREHTAPSAERAPICARYMRKNTARA